MCRYVFVILLCECSNIVGSYYRQILFCYVGKYEIQFYFNCLFLISGPNLETRPLARCYVYFVTMYLSTYVWYKIWVPNYLISY